MIRKYDAKDKNSVLMLLSANTPEYFHPSEKDDFETYLDNEIEDYFVYLEDNDILGAGGVNYFPNENTARISWDLVHPSHQGKGIGAKLLTHRIEHIKKRDKIDIIQVRTSQIVYKFYEKMSFQLQFIEENFWAKGFHLYQLEKAI